MAIARYENLTIQNVVTTTDEYGQQVTSLTTFFNTRARVQDVRNSVQITKDDRVYSDLVKFVLNYTPNTREIVDNQNMYAIRWRNSEWRITDTMESNDRMNVTLYAYRNDPEVSV
jgi:head-tail adaptor